jgi:mannose-1-phosphate guanylyltransferase
MEHTYAVIMAGGGGTRLWPISRKKLPKHFLPMLGKRTLFQGALDRLEGFIPADKILVVSTSDQAPELVKQAPQLKQENLLIEPFPRGTASAIGLAASVLLKRDPDAIMLVLTSDHYIRNIPLFHQIMQAAVNIARKDYIVTIGITPTFPATGYGYIQQGVILPETFELPAYRVLQFIEKPDEKKAKLLLEDGDHSWNSGMFVWRAERILNEFARQMPDLRMALANIYAAWGKSNQNEVLGEEWARIRNETIDYGIMEHAGNVAVLPAGDLDWSDIGSWDSLFDLLPGDEHGNVVVNGDTLTLDTHNSLIFSSAQRLVVTIGMEDLIVIDSQDALLICRRNQAQKVRQVIENLKKLQQEDYL